jgi:glycosyltransferase involved in cell wall biosynthesis
VAELGSPFGYQPVWRWRDRWRPLLAGARRVICPSRDVAERTRRHFPEARYLVRPHPEPERAPVAPAPARSPGEPLRVAVPGAIGEQKGFALLIDCAEDARRRRLPLEYHVVGYTMNDARARKAGPYEPEEADERLAASGCHLAFLPSVSPETYSFTLSSVLRARLYPVVLDLGAMAERLRDLGWGEVLPWSVVDDAAAINDALLAVEVPPPPVPSTPWAARRYSSLVKDFYEDFDR